jgi:GT2 family glycosyltransferase
MNKKILLATLNHNQPELTDNLVTQWNRDPFVNNCEIMVVDNGSTEPLAKTTTHRLEENIFFTGGFNVILEYFLSGDYEYLAMYNNDIVFHGYNFLTNVFKEIHEHKIDMYTPSVINGSENQCKWKTVWNWGSGTVRKVKYIDDQCPILSRRLCEAIKKFPDELLLGYGTDFYESIIANRNGYTIGVSDTITVCHLENQTVKRNKLTTITNEEYYNMNYHNMMNFFNSSEFAQEYKELFSYGESYDYYKELSK